MQITLPRLVGEQCRILYLPENANQVVLGVAGSGKSVEAAYRAVWISIGHPNDKILVLSVNRDVNIQLKKMIDSYNHNANIEVSTVYSYFKKLMNKYYPQNGYFRQCRRDYLEKKEKSVDDNQVELVALTRDEEEECLENVITNTQKQYPDSTLWNKNNVTGFIKDEIKWMKENNVRHRPEYLNIKRIGRGNQRLSPQQRQIMFNIYRDYYKQVVKETGKVFDFDDIYYFVKKYCVTNIPEQKRPKYIIIDEVQDISPVMFDGLQAIIAPDGYWTVFGDTSQNIFGQRISWQSLGLSNIRKQYRLHRNYRNTKQIGALAKSILDTDLFSVARNDQTFIEPSLSAFCGSLPLLWHIRAGHLAPLKQFLNKHLNSSTAVVAMSFQSEEEVEEILKKLKIPFETNIEKWDDQDKQHVFLGTINQIKGLEFDSVAVLFIDDLQPRLSDDANENGHLAIDLADDDKAIIAKTVYVAMTRARKNLLLAYRNNPLSFLFHDDQLIQKVSD